MKKNYIALTVILLCVLLCGCGRQRGYYVDIAEEEAKIKDSGSSNTSSDYVDEQRVNNLHWDNITYTDDELILHRRADADCFRLDLNSGERTALCEIPGCTHDPNTHEPYCINYMAYDCLTYTAEGMYYTDYNRPGKRIYREGNEGKEKVVYVNTFSTELSEELEPGRGNSVRGIIRGNIFYVMGSNYVYLVDMNSWDMITEPMVLSDNFIQFVDVWDEYLWCTNLAYELICYNILTGEVIHVDDKVGNLQCYDGYLYYAQGDVQGGGVLMRRDIDGSNPVKITDVHSWGAEIEVTDTNIYFDRMDGIYVCDRDGGNVHKLNLTLTYEEGYTYSMDSENVCLMSIFSNRFSNYVYIIDRKRISDEVCTNALFRVDKETQEIRAYSLGVYYKESPKIDFSDLVGE